LKGKVWDAKTSDALMTIAPTAVNSLTENAIHSIAFFPNNPELILVCNRSPTLYIMNIKGEVHKISLFDSNSNKVLKKITHSLVSKGEFIACCISPKGSLIFALSNENMLFCFDTITGKCEHTMKVWTKSSNTHHEKGC
jgi:WD40 repeat-containing protein SMU1